MQTITNRIRKIIIIPLLIFTSYAYGQGVTGKTDKRQYKTSEIILLEYHTNQKVDSVGPLKINGFYISLGPSKSSSASIISGETKYSFQLKYELKAIHPGKLEIVSPVFYIEKSEQRSNTIILEITGEKLSENELDKIAFDKFKESSKPAGTMRVIFSDKYGYVEEFKNSEWVFLRQLKPKEIRKYRKRAK